MKLPEGAQVRLGAGTPYNHGHPITALAKSRNRLATAGPDGKIHLWDTVAAREEYALPLHDSAITALAYSPDGEKIASVSRDGRVKLSTHDGEPEWIGRGSGEELTDVAFNPNGDTLVTVGYDRQLRTWSTDVGRETGGRVAPMEINAVAIAPNGSAIVTADIGGGLIIWSGDGNEKEAELNCGQIITALAVSPSSRWFIAGCNDGSTRLFDIHSHREVRKLPGHHGAVNAIAFSKTGARIATGGDDGLVCLWEKRAKEPIILEGHRGRVQRVLFDTDKDLLWSAGEDGVVRVWDLKTRSELYPEVGHEGAIKSVAWVEGIASGGADRSVRVWDPHSGDQLARFGGHEDGIGSVEFLDATSIVAADCAGRLAVHRFGVGSGAPFAAEEFCMDHDIAVLPGTQLVVSAVTLSVWDCDRGRELLQLRGLEPGEEFNAIVASPDGKLIVAGRDTIEETDGEASRWAIWQDPFMSNAWLPTWGNNGSVIALCPRGDLLASAGQGAKWIRVRHVGEFGGEWKVMQSMKGHTDLVTALAFSPDGSILASTSLDGTVRLWDPRAGVELVCFEGALAPLCFSPDGANLVTGAVVGGLLVWETRE